MTAGDAAPEGLLGAALACALLAWVQRSFERREAYLLWLLPAFLLGIFIGAIALATHRPMFVGTLLGLVGAAVVLGGRSVALQRAHVARLASVAHSIGFKLVPSDPTCAFLADALSNEAGACLNVIRGEWHGVPIAAFDYFYTDLTDVEAPAHVMLTCCLVMLTRSLPHLVVRQLKLREAIAFRFGSTRNMLGDGRFDSRFRVEALDADGARDALTPRAREWLIANARGLKVVVDGDIALVSTRHRTIAELPELFDQLRELRIALS